MTLLVLLSDRLSHDAKDIRETAIASASICGARLRKIGSIL
ncbi:MAG: hypothetical protein ABIQ38_04810 [Ilumatobacteraceae bacterium]